MGNKMGNNLNPISDIMFEELFYESEYFIREFPTSLSHFRISQIDNNTLTQINVDRVLLKSRVNHALENIKGYESFKRLIYNFEIILIDLDLLKQMIDTCEIVFPVTMDS
ncbi:MAG TPA: hypothetical protein PK904_04245 [Bacteroidales bacterium]|nr:hypothetical protein [Bacteroidales bacterium]